MNSEFIVVSCYGMALTWSVSNKLKELANVIDFTNRKNDNVKYLQVPRTACSIICYCVYTNSMKYL